MRRKLPGASAEEEGMSHYENLGQEAPSIMSYFGKYNLVINNIDNQLDATITVC